MNKRLCRVLMALVFGLGIIQSAKAQWQTQTIVVSNGWTAIYLYVDASSQPILPATPGLPIAPDNPVDKVWLWKAPATTAQYISTPASPLSGGGPWVYWGVTNAQNSLTALIPNAAYLIHSTAATNYIWKIKGHPVPPFYTWDLTGLNFVGFPTPPVNAPNFQNFFSQAPAIDDIVQVYQYLGGELSAANPALVVNPQHATVTRGAAYWVSATNVNNTYFGPFNVSLPNSSGINFGTTAGQMTFHLINLAPTNLTVTLSLLPSEIPPTGQAVIFAPPPLLLEGALNTSNLTYAYTALATNNTGAATNSVSWTLPPYGQSGSDVAITLGVNRSVMTSPAGSLYAGILQFTDSLGFADVNIPVSATSANNNGLWIGNANVSQVSYDLKSYATNANGTLVVSAITNAVVITNTLGLGVTTNLAVIQALTTNLSLTYFSVSNEVVNNYTPLQVSNAGQYVVTNSLTTYSSTTNLVLQTTVTGWTLSPDGTTLDYLTATTTNGPFVTTLALSTNLFLATNYIGSVTTSPTNLLENAQAVAVYDTMTDTVTNAPDSDPVTNSVTGSYAVTNLVAELVVANNAFVTNSLSAGTTSTNLPAVVNTYVISNAIVTVYPPATNFYPVPHPLVQSTNSGEIIYANVQTNFTLVTVITSPTYITNLFVTTNNYTILGAATNLVSATTTLYSNEFTGVSHGSISSSSNVLINFGSQPEFSISTNMLVSSVSNYVVTAHNTSLDAVSSPFPIRLLVFSGTNTACLLQRVFYGLNAAGNIVISTTQNSLDPTQLASARRISSAVLPWAATNNPYYFTGGTLAQGTTLTTTFTEAYDDQAANPFLHTYHPDHNNLDLTQNPPRELPKGTQSYDITHVITLAFTPNTGDFLSLTTANTQLSGNYRESITLTGLGGATRSYQTAGTFSLIQVSPIQALTTQ